MLSRYRMLGLLCLDNQKRPICLGFAEHAPRHSESFPGQPCPLWERVGVRGYGPSMDFNPSPGLHLTMQSDLSHKG